MIWCKVKNEWQTWLTPVGNLFHQNVILTVIYCRKVHQWDVHTYTCMLRFKWYGVYRYLPTHMWLHDVAGGKFLSYFHDNFVPFRILGTHRPSCWRYFYNLLLVETISNRLTCGLSVYLTPQTVCNYYYLLVMSCFVGVPLRRRNPC